MSDIGLILNGFLGVLLVGALLMGWRLEGRLKALRASHASFAKAVEDLDRAAARAEQGLADLRAATDEAAESLAGRIDRAGNLASKLERLTAEAVNVEARLAAQPRPAAPRGAVARLAERQGDGARPAAPARARTDLILEDASPPAGAAERPSLAERLERLRGLARGRPAAPRQAAALDDELFDEPAPRRAAGDGR